MKEHKYSKIIYFLALVFCYFILQYKFVNDMWFGTDELDVMIIGKGIARGQLLYVDAISQHMPFSYYISALFYKLGAVSVTEQRLAFYLLFALLWAGIVFLYSSKVDKRALLLYPLIHCCIIENYDLGTTILSEHLAGCGAVILLLEYISFSQERKLNLRNCIMISLSIVLTFGTIFIAIYAVFFIAIGVLLLELKWKKERNILIKDWIPLLAKKYSKFLIIVAAPWVVLVLYYVLTHSFGEFIDGAYTINREIYPKYTGGLGSNIFAMFFVPIEMISSVFIYGFNLADWNYIVVLQWVIILCSIIYFYKSIMTDGKIVGIISFIYTFALGVRGVFNFHGTACVEVLAFLTSYTLIVYGFKSVNNFKKLSILKQSLLVITLLLILSGYFKNISEVVSIDLKESETPQSKVLRLITEEDEGVWVVMFNNQDVMLADRIVVGASPTTPWTWEAFGKRQFKEIKKNPPRVVLFNKDHEVWGHKFSDYAPKVMNYINDNYTLIPNTSNVYVLNEYYEEALEKLE